MGVKTKKFVRKPIYVEGLRVTAKNFAQVMAWAGGEERLDEDKATGTTKKYIRIETQHAKNERQRKAFIGDWVLKTDKGFKIYSNYAFHRSFDTIETEASERQVEVDPQQSDVFLNWMHEDFAAYWNSLSDEDKKRLISSWTAGTGMPLAASEATPADAVVTPPTAIESIGSTNGVYGELTEAQARERLDLPEKVVDDVVPVVGEMESARQEETPVVEDGTGLKIEDSPTAPPPVHQG